MKLNCEGINLSEAIMRVSKACASKTTAPILECVHFVAKNDTLTLTATDGEITIRKSIPAEVLQEGECCIPGRIFADFIKRLETEELSLCLQGNSLRLTYGASASSIQALSGEEFPKIATDINECSFEIERSAFKDLVTKTVFCCASDDSRPILKGCLIEVSGGAASATALDGYRMATCKRTVVSASKDIRLICPARTLSEIVRMIPDGEGTLTVYTRSGMLMVEVEDTLLTSKLYKGDFVNKNDLVPKRFETVITVNKAQLSESIERAAIIVKTDRFSLIVFDITSDGVAISSASDLGNVSENVDAGVEGKDLKIAMNAKYILESLRAIDGEDVKISFNSSISPLICTNTEESDESSVLYLILPVRT